MTFGNYMYKFLREFYLIKKKLIFFFYINILYIEIKFLNMTKYLILF